MKRISVLFMAGMILAGLCAFAQAGTAVEIRASVPFPFYANGELVPAGTYVFALGAVNPYEASGSSVMIRNDSGTVAARLLTFPGNSALHSDARLTFNRYENTYFLSSVEGHGSVANLRTTKAEREMRVQGRQKKGSIIEGAF